MKLYCAKIGFKLTMGTLTFIYRAGSYNTEEESTLAARL